MRMMSLFKNILVNLTEKVQHLERQNIKKNNILFKIIKFFFIDFY